MVYGAKPLHTPDSANKRIYLHKQLMVSAPVSIAPRQHSVDHSPPGAPSPQAAESPQAAVSLQPVTSLQPMASLQPAESPQLAASLQPMAAEAPSPTTARDET